MKGKTRIQLLEERKLLIADERKYQNLIKNHMWEINACNVQLRKTRMLLDATNSLLRKKGVAIRHMYKPRWVTD